MSAPLQTLWVESHRLRAGEAPDIRWERPLTALPTEDQLAQALTALDPGPTAWILDDLHAPAILLRDVAELPDGTEAREAFWRWKFQQSMALDAPYAVQTLLVEPGLWLAAGIREDWRETWMSLAQRLERPIHSLQPRWLHLYNRLAADMEAPGLLLSLSPAEGGRWTGTLAAWGRTLSLLRTWADPADMATWQEERLAPTIAYLQREGRSPQALVVHGAATWTCPELPVRLMREDAAQEARP
ncbi:MAG TPA: hypothetical protein VJ623_10610 [Holophagaceae bacterium]|nr:hypothetical protein [Holophagaceae bacterium]